MIATGWVQSAILVYQPITIWSLNLHVVYKTYILNKTKLTTKWSWSCRMKSWTIKLRCFTYQGKIWIPGCNLVAKHEQTEMMLRWYQYNSTVFWKDASYVPVGFSAIWNLSADVNPFANYMQTHKSPLTKVRILFVAEIVVLHKCTSWYTVNLIWYKSAWNILVELSIMERLKLVIIHKE